MAKRSAAQSKLKWRLRALELLSLLVTVLPLLAVFGMNWSVYTKTPADTVKLCLGGGIVVVFLILKVLGKLALPRRVIVYAIVFVLAFLLEAVLDDLMLISGAALLGEGVDYIFFQRAIRATREAIAADKTADATAGKVEEILQSYLGGRV